MAESYRRVERGVYARDGAFYVGFMVGGRWRREKGGATLAEARKTLRIKRGQVLEDRYVAPDKQKLTVGQCLDRLLQHWKTARNGRPIASYGSASRQVERVRERFGQARARDLRKGDLRAYLDESKTDQERGTRSLRLAYLQRALRLAQEDDLLDSALPKFPARVDNVRQGFVEPEYFEDLVSEFDGVDAEVLGFAYALGWRIRAVLDLHWSQVDRGAWQITLGPSTGTKTKPEIIPVVGEALRILEARWRVARAPWLVFHRDGKAITYNSISARWRAVMKRRKIHVILHDFRRSCSRNLLNAGVDAVVASKITGHKALGTFKRYGIQPTQAIKSGLEKLEAYKTARSHGQSVHGTVQKEA